jgi:glutamyl-tRNA reductase
MQMNTSIIEPNEMSGLMNIRATHKKTPIPILEVLRFKDEKKASRDLIDIKGVEECIIVQTCNRVEINLFISSNERDEIEKKVSKYWLEDTHFEPELFYPYIETTFSKESLHHLFGLASSLKSMIIGEDQILGQIQEAYLRAKDYSTVGTVLRKVFERSVKVGKMVRAKTDINRGSVSIGSISIRMLEEIAGDLKDKNILIIGAGRIGALAGKALATRNLSFIFVANRTYERAVSLAKILNAKAIRFDKLTESLASADIVLVATSASHYILNHAIVEEGLKHRKRDNKLILVDLSQPRNIDIKVEDHPEIELHNIDNLRQAADANLEIRKKEAEKAEKMIQEEIDTILSYQKKLNVEPIIQAVSSRADKIRRKEVDKAYRLMKTDSMEKTCDKCRLVMDNLSRKLLERVMLDPILSLRNAEFDADFTKISLIQEIFKVDYGDTTE